MCGVGIILRTLSVPGKCSSPLPHLPSSSLIVNLYPNSLLIKLHFSHAGCQAFLPKSFHGKETGQGEKGLYSGEWLQNGSSQHRVKDWVEPHRCFYCYAEKRKLKRHVSSGRGWRRRLCRGLGERHSASVGRGLGEKDSGMTCQVSCHEQSDNPL